MPKPPERLRVLIKGPPTPLQRRCASCMTTHGDLKLCTGCRLVRYCRSEHQAQHWLQHKALCKKAARFQNRVFEEDLSVRNAAPAFLSPANAFETHAGRFGEVLSTRGYMLARYVLADHAVYCGTMDGAVEALDHFRDMIRLDRSDTCGLFVSETIPGLMLRLDLDQECYDFIKWWETAGADRHYDWSDMTLPFLSVKDADVLEEPVFLLSKGTPLSFQSAILLLKLKLLVDIRNLKVARKVVRNRLPPELWAFVERDVIRSPLSTRFIGSADLEGIEDTLANQCYYLGAHISQSNRHFIPALLRDMPELFSIRPNAYPKGSPEEAVLAIQFGYLSWWETLGALDLLRDACDFANINWECTCGHASEHLPAGGAKHTIKDPLDVSRMWEHLDEAIKENSYLGLRYQPANGRQFLDPLLNAFI